MYPHNGILLNNKKVHIIADTQPNHMEKSHNNYVASEKKTNINHMIPLIKINFVQQNASQLYVNETFFSADHTLAPLLSDNDFKWNIHICTQGQVSSEIILIYLRQAVSHCSQYFFEGINKTEKSHTQKQV